MKARDKTHKNLNIALIIDDEQCSFLLLNDTVRLERV